MSLSSSSILAAVLGAALIAVIAALVVTETRSNAASGSTRGTRRARGARSAPTSAVTGREALDSIDLGLRRLAGDCARADRAMPDVYALGYSGERLTLRLAGSDRTAPGAWTVDEDAEEWHLASDEIATYGPHEPPHASHPYALAVTLGLLDEQRVLVDLSRVSGAIAVSGDGGGVRELVRAMLSELITGPVGRYADVTLVGAVATTDMTAGLGLQSSRLHTVASLEEALTDAAYTATHPVVSGIDEPQVTQVFRLIEGHRPAGGQGHVSRLFVMEVAQYLDEKAGSRSLHEGDALLVVGDAPDFAVRFTVGADGSVDTGPLGVRVDRHAGRVN
ncbi:hypothetical protein AB0H77_29540 [Streptomyces sp. NPDC050844]|uniref:hypothetical protein n=1 Tax=Streptomyces sp. NPDC050844 TaxID=3155790 RepID=UPI00340C6D9C